MLKDINMANKDHICGNSNTLKAFKRKNCSLVSVKVTCNTATVNTAHATVPYLRDIIFIYISK